jgi:hypothetical protein
MYSLSVNPSKENIVGAHLVGRMQLLPRCKTLCLRFVPLSQSEQSAERNVYTMK